MRDFGPVDLANYLIWQSDLLTPAESVANEILILRAKFPKGSELKPLLQRRYSEEILLEAEALLAEGEAVFKERLVARILSEHGEASLNLCPKCDALCRTKVARQCPRCFFEWRGELGQASDQQ